MNEDDFKCEDCGKDCEELTRNTGYANMIETGWLCGECMDEVDNCR